MITFAMPKCGIRPRARFVLSGIQMTPIISLCGVASYDTTVAIGCILVLMMTSTNGDILRVTGPVFLRRHRAHCRVTVFLFVCLFIKAWIYLNLVILILSIKDPEIGIPPSQKMSLYEDVGTMAADGLAMQGARMSMDMLPIWLGK